MTANVVEILVKADNVTGAGFGEAAAGAEELAAKTTAAMNEYDRAVYEATQAREHLDQVLRDSAASEDDIAAASDRAAKAAGRERDAWLTLGDAQLAESAKAREAGAAQETLAVKTKESGAAAAGAGGLFGQFKAVAGFALAGIGYESVKMAMSFQKAMEMLVTQAGVPQSHLAALKAGVLDLAGKVGFSPDSLAESLYHVASNMASMGATSATMLKVVQTAAEGAKVGGAGLVDVTNALGAAIASGIPGVQNFGQAMGALNAIVGAGDMHMQDLAEAMGTGVLAVVKGYGLSLKDVGAALATFGDNNIRGAQAATDLRMAVMALAVPAAAGKKELAGMGLSMTDLAATMRQHGLLATLEELQAHFKAAGVTAKEQGDVITQIFGKKAGTGLNVLMDQMDRLKSKYPAITAGANEFGSAWQKTQQNLSQQWDQLRGTFDALLTSVGTKLIPVLSSVAGFLLQHKAIIATLTPVVLALVGAFLGLSVAMKAINIAKDAFALLTSPVGLVTIAIAALAFGIYELIKHWKTVEKAGKEAFDAIKDAWSHVYSAVVSPVISAFDAVKSFITGNFDGWWKSHGEEIKQVWHVLWTAIHDIFEFEWVPIMLLAKTGWDAITMIFKVGMAIVTGIFKVGWDYTVAVFKVAWNLIGGTVKVAIDYIKMIIKVTWDVIVGIFNVFLDLITGHWSKAWTDLKTMFVQVWNAIKAFFSSALSDMTGAFSRAMSAIVSGARAIVSDMFRAGVAIVEGLIHGIESMFGAVVHTAENLVSSLGHSVLHLLGIGSPSKVAAWWGQMVAQGMADGIDAHAHLVAGAASRMALRVPAGLAAGSGGAGYAAAGGPVQVQLQVVPGGGSEFEQFMLLMLRNWVRVKGGGDVQKAFGR